MTGHVLTRLVLPVVLFAAVQAAPSPERAVDALIAADRAFSAAGAKKNAVASISAMFADDVVLPAPGGVFVEGKARAIEALMSNPENAASSVEWTPIRGGVSADAQHGFTFGYMTLRKADGTQTPMKYLAYWIRQNGEWRVLTYRRRPRAAGSVSTALLPPSLPARPAAAPSGPDSLEQHRRSLAAAEQAFSDEAQKIGLGAAFTKFASPDAINMGGANTAAFVSGAEAIGRAIGEGTPTDSSAVFWSADHKVVVAATGDLGVTFGFIRQHSKTAQPPTPFFTIWRRATPDAPWRYIAE